MYYNKKEQVLYYYPKEGEEDLSEQEIIRRSIRSSGCPRPCGPLGCGQEISEQQPFRKPQGFLVTV